MNSEDLDLTDLELNNSDNEETPITASEVVEIMEKAWLNEKFSPEILPNKYEIVECLLGQIHYMEENLERLESTDFQKSIHQLEIDRLRFLITSYLRNRLDKTENYVFSILKQEEERFERSEPSYLTDAELDFARDYKDCLVQHFETILNPWPGLVPDDWKNNPITPNMYSFVFLKAKEEIEGIPVDSGNADEEDLIDIKADSQMLMSYKNIARLVRDEKIQLI